MFSSDIPRFSSFYFHHFATCIQSVSSLRSACPNHLGLPFLITKLTGSNPNSYLNYAFFPLSFKVNPHIYLIMLISVLSSVTSCYIFIGQVSPPYVKQFPTHDEHRHTFSFSFNTNPYLVSIGRYSRNFSIHF